MINEILRECSNLPGISPEDIGLQEELNKLLEMQIRFERMNDTEDLPSKVIGWAQARGIFDNPRPMSQFMKTVSEMGELADNLGKHNIEDCKDDIGDIEVTLIILKEMLGFRQDECLRHAWSEIKDRQGKMVNGVFVKE
jgi:NTP pyrophosphatase (non-canonical NTP hydrolase)